MVSGDTDTKRPIDIKLPRNWH